MIKFEKGQKYELLYSAAPRAGSVAGYVEIVSVNRIPENEIVQKSTSIKGCFDAHAGEITFIVHSETTNDKKKKAVLIQSFNSEEYAREYCGGDREYEWFSPTKRSYYPISAREGEMK